MALLTLTGIVKDFPGVRAVDNVSFDLEAGEVHALLGENGAGKSTLLKILGGLYAATEGSITVDGEPLTVNSPNDAHAAGVSVIHQEFNLVPDLTVAENIWLGKEPHDRRSRRLDKAAMRERSVGLLERLGLDIDPATMVSDLSVSAQQMVEIAKALTFDARVIVMDEPTAALDDQETDHLFAVVEQLRSEGKGIIYVSHRLAEIFRIADRATVLRDGASVGTVSVADVDEDELIRMMVGREVDAVFHREPSARSDVALRVQGLGVGRRVKDVSFEVHAGEILGFGGLDGCGAYEVLQAVFGIAPRRSGTLTLGGQPYAPGSPRDALEAGVGFLPRDRKATGVLPDLSVRHNLSIATVDRMGSNGLVDRLHEDRILTWFTKRLAMKFRHPTQPIRFLSGGNQQKVLIARSLVANTKVLALAEPTRGVDVGAKGEIHDLLNELTAQGMAVLMLSTDLLELLGMSDRVVVMHEGRVTAQLAGAALTDENVVAAATGRRIGLDGEGAA